MGAREPLSGAGAPTVLGVAVHARVPLHRLFPLLVHVVLFGGRYAAQAASAARAALRAR